MKSLVKLLKCNHAPLPLAAAAGLLIIGAANAASYSGTVLADNPIAYWRFEELSGSFTAADSSASGTFTGTYNGSPTLGLPGIDTNSIGMQAPPNTTSPVSVGYYPELNPAGAFSFEIWAPRTALALVASIAAPSATSAAGETHRAGSFTKPRRPEAPSPS